MDEITLSISNPNNKAYASILMRKFFLMLFIDADGKKIHAYIASVFGGIKAPLAETNENLQDLSDVLPVLHDSSERCYLFFKFSSEKNVIDHINFEDKTESFCEQTEWISKVWGNNERCENKGRVDELLKQLYAEHYKGDSPTKVDSGVPVYYFSEKKRPFHSFLAARGDYEFVNENSYRLLVPSEKKAVMGIEVINWIKADISLKFDLRSRPVAFSIDFGDGRFYTPDFTWYLAPPAGYVVDGESYVKVGELDIDKNAISAVSDETDVLFEEWKEERITERKKSRVLFSTISGCMPNSLSNHKKLTVFLHIANPQGPSNRQFVIGLLVAFLLSFCSDKTRINDYYSCLLKYCTCADRTGDFCGKCSFICNALSVMAPVLVLLTFLVCILNPKRCFPTCSSSKEGVCQFVLKGCRFGGIILAVILAVYVFIVWLLWPNVLGLIGCDLNSIILMVIFSIATVMNIAYLVYCLGYLKRNIINYL